MDVEHVGALPLEQGTEPPGREGIPRRGEGTRHEPPEPPGADLVAAPLEGEDVVAALLEQPALRLEHRVLAARRLRAVVVVGQGDAEAAGPTRPTRPEPGHESTGQAAPMRPGSSESA